MAGRCFAQLVQRADPSIRAGDDVRVIQDGACIGLARALAHGWEWAGTPERSQNLTNAKKGVIESEHVVWRSD